MLVVHIGAGSHLRTKDTDYKKILANALACESYSEASRCLEEPILTNTGRGSSINMVGNVECDACIIRGDMAAQKVICGVAAHNIQHKTPIEALCVAEKGLSEVYGANYTRWGLSAPVVFDYGAIASTFGFPETSQEELVEELKKVLYDLYKERITRGSDAAVPIEVQDTIGLIHAENNQLSVLSSSGGNFFKLPGRSGCAAIPGAATAVRFCGPWTISCLCSGNGDDIVQMNLAAKVVQSFDDIDTFSMSLVPTIEHAGSQVLLQAQDMHGKSILYVGVLGLICNSETKEAAIVYAHSTETFYFGFRGKKTRTVLSRSKPGVFVQGEYKIN